MKKVLIFLGLLILSTGLLAKTVSLHCAKDSEFDLTDANKNDSLHDYLVRLNLNEEGKGAVKFFRYQHYPLVGPYGRSFTIPAGRFRKHEWFNLSQLCKKGSQFYCWDKVYDFYKVEWYLNRKTLELINQTRWAGYDPNKERKAAYCRVVKEDEFDSLSSQIITFHKEFHERKTEKARREAEEKEEEFSI